MHCDRPRLILGNVEKLRDDVLWWTAAIEEVQVNMLDAVVDEMTPVILFPVEADHKVNASLSKDWHVVHRRKHGEPIGIRRRRAGTGEGKELLRNDPVHVPILNLLEELVGLHVEAMVIEPPNLDTLLDALQTVQDGEVERAHSTDSISEGQKRRVNARERLIRHFGTLTQNDHLIGSDQARRVGSLLRIMRAVMDHALVRRERIAEFPL
mmetsp:Transcript_32095/g.70221  ORF Transcript_32095/g.70221 Transcript_32095/m.70221 type:complete len:210 (+) Transcript_32095:632-1261(+)